MVSRDRPASTVATGSAHRTSTRNGYPLTLLSLQPYVLPACVSQSLQAAMLCSTVQRACSQTALHPAQTTTTSAAAATQRSSRAGAPGFSSTAALPSALFTIFVIPVIRPEPADAASVPRAAAGAA